MVARWRRLSLSTEPWRSLALWIGAVGLALGGFGALFEMTDRLGTDPGRDRLYESDWPSPVVALAALPAPQQRIVNGVGMEMVVIPPGEFIMGSPTWEEARSDDELPHRVRLTEAFYLGAREVTIAEFRRFVEESGYVLAAKRHPAAILCYGPAMLEPPAARYDVDLSGPADSPVTNVTWDDAREFCRWLTLKEGRRYRLPTEAEWEYACRAGAQTAFFWGDDAAEALRWARIMPAHWGGSADSAPARAESFLAAGVLGSVPVGERLPSTSPAGRAPNPLGLFDMHGSVWEWCADWYDAEYYRRSPSRDPQGPTEGKRRVVRGGCRGMLALQCRAARRSGELPDRCDCTLGFRVAADFATPADDPSAPRSTDGIRVL